MKLSTVHKQRLAKIGRVTLAGAMVAGSVGNVVASPVDAGATYANKTTITDSRPGQASVGYTITFTTPAASTAAIEKVTVKFCNDSGSFSGCVGPTGLALAADLTTATAAGFGGVGGPSAGTFTRIGDNEFDFEPTTPAAEDEIEHTLTLTGLISNPSSADTYYTMIQTYSDATLDTLIDQGTSAFAIVQKVDVTGRVAESMAFEVKGINTGQTCGGENAGVTSTPTSVPFENFTSGTPRVACQTVETATNAFSGYTTSVRHLRAGTSPRGGMCRQTSTDCTASGADTTTPTTDVIVDAGLTGTAATWTNGTTFGVGLNANGGQAYSATFSSQNNVYVTMFGATAKVVASATGPTAATPTTIKLKADVPATQTAGLYQNGFEYITTPTF